MAAIDKRTAATAVAAIRVGYGLGMAAAPRTMLRVQLGRAADVSGPFVWLARAFGVRDAVLGAGALLAGDDESRRGWVAAGVVADGLDAVSALAGGRLLGRGRSLVVAATALSATAGGAWSLSG